MSRIGKLPITVPSAVKVKMEGSRIAMEGPKGKIDWNIPKRIAVKHDQNTIVVTRDGDDSQAKALHGLTRAIVNNMVKGVSEGFVRKLEIQGVGFKAAVQGKVVNLSLGYSHPVNYAIPESVKVTVEENTKITVEGPSKELVGLVASEIRSYYPPEPYKGKGVRYSDEKVLRKEGKTVQ